MTYLDDIIIFSDTEEEHMAHIEEIFKRLEAADLKMKRSKCDFFKKHIHYLGHLISADGIRPLKDKLDTIHDMPVPHNSKEVKQFLGLVGYYRKFVLRFCTIPVPVIVLCLSAIFVRNINSSELHFQSVALRSQYSDHAPEAVTLH